jgi:hypothetical protein
MRRGRQRVLNRVGSGPNPVHPHRPRNVLDLLLVEILEGVIKLVRGRYREPFG